MSSHAEVAELLLPGASQTVEVLLLRHSTTCMMIANNDCSTSFAASTPINAECRVPDPMQITHCLQVQAAHKRCSLGSPSLDAQRADTWHDIAPIWLESH